MREAYRQAQDYTNRLLLLEESAQALSLPGTSCTAVALADMTQTGNSGRRPRLPPAQRRALILSAALDIFADRGHETTLAEVARAAGVTRTVLYHYFSSKELLTTS